MYTISFLQWIFCTVLANVFFILFLVKKSLWWFVWLVPLVVLHFITYHIHRFDDIKILHFIVSIHLTVLYCVNYWLLQNLIEWIMCELLIVAKPYWMNHSWMNTSAFGVIGILVYKEQLLWYFIFCRIDIRKSIHWCS